MALARARPAHMPTRLSNFFREIPGFQKTDLVRNVAALYGIQFAGYLLPLVTVPYLSRVLGPPGWGMVAFAQSFGTCLSLIVEYGFGLSATREVARHLHHTEERARVLAGVLGAQALLTCFCLGAGFIAMYWVPAFRGQRRLLASGLCYGIALASNLAWYYQGLERMRFVALVDVSGKVLGTVAIFVFVRSPQDGWMVLGLWALSSFGAAVTLLVIAYRDTPPRMPTFALTRHSLRMGWSMFVFRSSVSLYTVGNAFILGLLAPPQYVGYYAGAERISRAFLGLLTPITQVLYPRLSYLVQHARNEAVRLARVSVAVMGGCGAALSLLVFLFAPLLVRLLLGASFDPAVAALRILSLLPLLIAMSNVFGVQWMLPLGLDTPFNVVILSAGVLNLAFALLLSPGFRHVGMACAVVFSETFVSLAIYGILRSRRLDPFFLRVPGEST